MLPSSFTAVVSVEMQSIADPNMLEMGDAGSDVPADVRVSCNEKAALRCTSHEQCAAMCLPAMDDHPWCCAGIECRPYALAASCPPR